MKAPIETVTAEVYAAKGEASRNSLRAKVLGTGMRISCPSAWREAWEPGQRIEFTGRWVSQNCGAAYFKATQQGGI